METARAIKRALRAILSAARQRYEEADLYGPDIEPTQERFLLDELERIEERLVSLWD